MYNELHNNQNIPDTLSSSLVKAKLEISIYVIKTRPLTVFFCMNYIGTASCGFLHILFYIQAQA